MRRLLLYVASFLRPHRGTATSVMGCFALQTTSSEIPALFQLDRGDKALLVLVFPLSSTLGTCGGHRCATSCDRRTWREGNRWHGKRARTSCSRCRYGNRKSAGGWKPLLRRGGSIELGSISLLHVLPPRGNYFHVRWNVRVGVVAGVPSDGKQVCSGVWDVVSAGPSCGLLLKCVVVRQSEWDGEGRKPRTQLETERGGGIRI